MSYYEDERVQRRRSRHDNGRRDSEYVEDDYAAARGGLDPRDSRQETRLVRRARDESVSSAEEVKRDWAPGDRGYIKETVTRRSGVRPARAKSAGGRDRWDDRSSYYSSKRSEKSSKGYDDKRDRRSRRHSSSSSRSPPPRRSSQRRKSMGEEALAALGLGGVMGTLLGKKSSRSRSRSRSGERSRGGRGRTRSYSSSRSQSRSRRRGKSTGREQISQALKAAVLAGGVEAFRARKEPGGWGGDKGKRILTAAISAGGVDGLIDRDPDKHGTRNVISSALAGVATNRVINGPRSRSRGPGGRAGSADRGGNGVRDLAAGGILAAGAKSIYDRVRSKSRGRRARSTSSSSYDSVSPRRRRGGGSGYYSDSRDVGRPRSEMEGGGALSAPRSRGYSLDYGPHHNGDPETDSDSDLGSSSGEEKERKKMGQKQMLTAGLATIATIHAVHGVYQSVKGRDQRKLEVAMGEMSKKEAKEKKNKARLQDAASVGIAALGIKGAYSEWKEMKEKREEAKEADEKHENHAKKRAARRAKWEAEARRMRDSGFSGSLPNLALGGNGYYGGAGGPHYYDGNPYSASAVPPAPPPPPAMTRYDPRYQ